MRLRSLTLAGLLAVVAGTSVGAQQVPEVVLGPEAWGAANLVAAPIVGVTVFSDRARVRRHGRLVVKAGINTVRFPDLPGAAFTDTVRLAAIGARVIRVEATPLARERLDIAQAAKLLDDLDAVADRLTELDDRAALDNADVELLGRLHPAPPVPEEKREGRKALAIDVASWGRTLDYLTARTAASRERLVRLADERRELEARRDRLRAELRRLDQGGFADHALAVLGVVEVAATGTVDLELEYFVPGARWKPIYDLHFSPGRGQLRLDTAALVEQASGEDWDQATLAFSTAIPGRGIELPELLTWSLGERGDFVPTPRARPRPRAAAPAPPPARPSSALARRSGDASVDAAASVRERLALALGSEGGSEDEQANLRNRDVASEQRSGRLAKRAPQKGSLDIPAPSPSAVPPPSRDYADEVAVSSRMSEGEESSRPGAVRSFVSGVVQSLRGSPTPTTTIPLALQETVPAPATFNDPFLPAVSAGGLDYVYQAATPASVPSTGKAIRIPLDTHTFHTVAFYQAAPALSATAYLRARVRNAGPRPLLRGTAAIFTDGEFVAQGELQTTGPGGDVEFPLGADQDIRLVRQVVPHTQTTGVIRKTDQTDYDVELQVGNYKKQAITIDVVDQIPRSSNDKVEVKLVGSNPVALGAPDADGVLRWHLELPAGATRTIKLRYQITRPAGWQLFQH